MSGGVRAKIRSGITARNKVSVRAWRSGLEPRLGSGLGSGLRLAFRIRVRDRVGIRVKVRVRYLVELGLILGPE